MAISIFSCVPDSFDHQSILFEEILHPTQNDSIFIKDLQNTEKLLISGAYQPDSFPVFLDTSSISFTFYKFWNALEETNEYSAQNIYKTLQQHNFVNSDLTTQLSFYYCQQLVESDVNTEILDEILEIDFHNLDLIEQYAYLNSLYSICIAFSKNYNLQNTLSTIFYALHLIETNKNKHYFIKKENQFYTLYCNAVMNESQQLMNSVPKAINLIKRNNGNLNKTDINAYLDVLYLDSIMFDVEKIMALSINPKKKHEMLTTLGFINLANDSRKSIDIFNQAALLVHENSYRFRLLNIYKVYAYINLKDYKKAKNELAKAKNFDKLFERNKEIMTFLCKRIELELLSNLDHCDSIYHKNHELRLITKKLFDGHKSSHLEDFYSQNTVEFLKLIKNCYPNVQEYESELISMFYESKWMTRNNLLGINFIEDIELNKDLIKINDFQSFKKLQDPIYEKIFIMSTNEYVNSLNKKKIFEQESIDFEVDSLVVNFIVHDSQYGVYVKDSKNFDVILLDRELVDSLTVSLIDEIKQESISDELLDKIRSVLHFINQLPAKREIHIIPDGQLSMLPFEVIFPEKKFSYLKSINQFKLAPLIIEPQDGVALCYSSKKTINSREKRLFPELQDALQESLMVHEITGAKLYCGYKLNRESFFASLDASFFHLATHGESDADNRLNNFIILRNEKLMDTLYSYEIVNSKKHPEVAVLSSCNSGTGEFYVGSGTFSIANALSKNGTNHIIKTLWPINDEFTNQFMEKLYSHWNSDTSLKAAMQLTKQYFRNQNYTCDKWAGFILEGPGNVYLAEE